MGGSAGLPTSTATSEGQATAPDSSAPAQAQEQALTLEAYRPSVTTLQGYEGYQNPFRSAPGTASNASPFLSIPGYENVRNPFYSPYQSQQAPTTPRPSDINAQYQAYTQGYAKNIQAAKDQRIADARAAEQAYQTAKANEALKAEYEKKLADQQAQFEQQQQEYANSYNSNNNYYYQGASGGDVGIAGLRRRK